MYKNAPVGSDYVEIQWARSMDEVAATAFVYGAEKLLWVGTNLLGRGHIPGSRNSRKLSLLVRLDVDRDNPRVAAILSRVNLDNLFEVEWE